MKVAVLAALAGSAAAFAPAQQGATTTAMSATEAQKDFFGLSSSMDFSKELGVQPPVSFPFVLLCSLVCGMETMIYDSASCISAGPFRPNDVLPISPPHYPIFQYLTVVSPVFIPISATHKTKTFLFHFFFRSHRSSASSTPSDSSRRAIRPPSTTCARRRSSTDVSPCSPSSDTS